MTESKIKFILTCDQKTKEVISENQGVIKRLCGFSEIIFDNSWYDIKYKEKSRQD